MRGQCPLAISGYSPRHGPLAAEFARPSAENIDLYYDEGFLDHFLTSKYWLRPAGLKFVWSALQTAVDKLLVNFQGLSVWYRFPWFWARWIWYFFQSSIPSLPIHRYINNISIFSIFYNFFYGYNLEIKLFAVLLISGPSLWRNDARTRNFVTVLSAWENFIRKSSYRLNKCNVY